VKRGFTLVELLVVIAILAILAGLVVGGYSRIVTSTRIANTDARVTGIGQQVRVQLGLAGACPAKLTDLKLEQPKWMEGGVYVDA
jgi:prepilin-type N-terminal cleavage/methylation domain-containing protein